MRCGISMRQQRSLATLVAILISSVACGPLPRGADSQAQNVFGSDDRQEITTDQYPWRAIGKLSVGCTGTLVGRDLVLTAAHCVIDRSTKALRADVGSFLPNFKNGAAATSSAITHVWWGTNDPDKYRSSDWAVLRLKAALGDQYGWLGIQPTNVDTFPAGLTVVGYSTDFRSGQTAGVHHNCSVHNRLAANGLVAHDCDASRGSSGGPVLRMYNNQLMVYGVHVSENRDGGPESLRLPGYDGTHPNFAIPSQGFLAQVKTAGVH